MQQEKLNRIRIVLRLQDKKNIWLAEQLGVGAVAVSRWCRNMQQPSLKTLFQIADLLEVPVCELLAESKVKRKDRPEI